MGLFLEWFVQVYYHTKSFKGALVSSWAPSLEARSHTGFVVMERSSWRDQPLHVYRLESSPNCTRPFGVDLPIIQPASGCTKPKHVWFQRYNSSKFGEQFYVFASSCCQLILYAVIYTDRRIENRIYKTHVTEEPWDPETECFTFDRETMVETKILVSISS